MSADEMTFSKMPLDRCSSLRKDKKWLKIQFTSSDSYFIPIWRGHYFFVENKLLKLSYYELAQLKENVVRKQSIFLGIENESSFKKKSAVFILDCSDYPEDKINDLFAQNCEHLEFRKSIALISTRQSAILSYGKSLSHWHNSNQYCGYCGQPSIADGCGHSRKCSSEACNKEAFPRTDPVVIMLVEYQPEHGPAQCLLAQHHRSHRASYQVVSTLAGFVDPGETLEEAVIREVKEEAGVDVESVTYMASQPWPFPGSLMIGFFAKAINNVINIDDEELIDAHWYTAEQVRQFDNWGDEGDNIQIPRKESIARYLIEQWLAEQP
ncbi:MAG: NAD+ diphosphatase [Alteromonadaceae bacterium]|jgi:NAD+ diphosphatase